MASASRASGHLSALRQPQRTSYTCSAYGTAGKATRNSPRKSSIQPPAASLPKPNNPTPNPTPIIPQPGSPARRRRHSARRPNSQKYYGTCASFSSARIIDAVVIGRPMHGHATAAVMDPAGRQRVLLRKKPLTLNPPRRPPGRRRAARRYGPIFQVGSQSEVRKDSASPAKNGQQRPHRPAQNGISKTSAARRSKCDLPSRKSAKGGELGHVARPGPQEVSAASSARCPKPTVPQWRHYRDFANAT